MDSILDVPSFRARVSRISVAKYHEMPERNENGRRTELIRGIVVEKPVKSPLHCSLARRIFDAATEAVPSGWLVQKDDPLTLADSEPEPDVSIVRGEANDFLRGHPSTAAFVCEVAVTSLAEDRALAPVYAEAGVAEYWIVIARSKSVEVYRRPTGSEYREVRLYGPGEELECTSVPGLRLRLDDLFADL